MKSDSAMWIRQKALWETQIGSKVELENRELVFQNSKVAYLSAKVKYDELKRQIDFTASQAQKNLLISAKSENDFIIRSQVNGKIYSITKSIGELVTPQTPVAVVGNDGNFVLEMQVDEVDIFMVKLDQAVKVSLESYKGSVFDAKVSKIIPYMNERSKTFLVEATFVHPPVSLFPNSTFEANILIQTKKSALLIPRNYLLNDSFVINSSGTKMKVVTGLKDYQKVEILSGLGKDDELLKPTE
jgi:multidrug efflux pump subunit AcrA (membrane-fusion protein)